MQPGVSPREVSVDHVTTTYTFDQSGTVTRKGSDELGWLARTPDAPLGWGLSGATHVGGIGQEGDAVQISFWLVIKGGVALQVAADATIDPAWREAIDRTELDRALGAQRESAQGAKVSAFAKTLGILPEGPVDALTTTPADLARVSLLAALKSRRLAGTKVSNRSAKAGAERDSSNSTQLPRLPTCLCLHDDSTFLATAIGAVKAAGPVYCFVSRRAWDGSYGCWERAVEVAEEAGAIVVTGDWPDEKLHRSAALAEMKGLGYRHILVIDGDEVLEDQLVEALAKIAKEDLADVVRCRMTTYWADAAHRVQPREELAPIVMLNAQTSEHIHIREYSGERVLTLGPEFGIMHHLSYAFVGSDSRIERKILTWGHKDEVGRDWYRNVWNGWQADPTLRNLHPTHPQAYGFIERIHPVPELAHLPRWTDETVEVPANWPSVSVVIPLHGGPEEIRLCLESLANSQDLIHETIVVDDASPDDAPKVAEGFEFATVIRSETNEGFAATCNKGLAASTGEVILFLNSDTVVPRAGIIRLIETLMESGTVGAAGPLSNNVGYYQRIEPTYTSLDALDLFAEDLAISGREDKDVEMLVGFALAVKRSVLDELGAFDSRFGVGMFDETDLCFRLARAGYRMRLSNRAYIHHWGSRSLQRAVPNMVDLLHRNEALYRKKWQRDLDIGYASHLPGLGVTDGLVKFNDDRHPDKVAREIERMRKQANISLCMIVKNESRVLRDCLESAKPFFNQIVVLDTGSTDGTQDIARECGADLHEMVWPNSFAEARNESLKYATGPLIFIMDADDTLPYSEGERLLRIALSLPKEIAACTTAVQFLEEGLGSGTRVVHVKLFRNKPGAKYVGRIHENVIESLHQYGQTLVTDLYVLHSGYDSSPDGQSRKRERDWPLLWLDYEERPEHPFPRFNIGMTYHFTSEHEKAVEWLEKSIEVSNPDETQVRKTWALMGTSLQLLGRPEAAEAALRRGLEMVGPDPELYFQLGIALTTLGRLPEALAAYEAMPETTQSHFYSLDVGILTFRRLHHTAGVRHAMEDYRGARADWLEALKVSPNYAPSILALFEAALAACDYRTAREASEALLRVIGPSAEWVEYRARLAEACGEPGGGAEFVMRLTQELPQAVGPRLVLARQLLNHQQVDAAVPHLQILEQQGVAEAAFFLGVACLQRGDQASALRYTERAVQLDPGNAQSREQLEKLRGLVDREIPSVLSAAEQRALLTGPHAGKLGKPAKRFSVVVVTYNSAPWIEACLASVLPTLGKGDEVIVVDNSSADDTVRRVKKLRDLRVKVIANPGNFGYSRAANIGILKSRGEAIVLLNPDTAVTPGWLEGMAAKLGEGVGAVGPVSDAISGQQFVGHYLKAGMTPRVDQLGEVFARDFPGRSVETKFIVGMCVMLPRAVLDTHGLLDEALVLGADDLDLSFRLRKLGLKLLIAMDVFVHHEGQASFSTRSKTETSELIAASDAALVAKLHLFYGPTLPTSVELWGCPIFDEALARWCNP